MKEKLRDQFSSMKPHQIILLFLINHEHNSTQRHKINLFKSCFNNFIKMQKSVGKVTLANKTKAMIFIINWKKVWTKMFNYSLRCKDISLRELCDAISKIPEEIIDRLASFFVIRSKIRHSIAFCQWRRDFQS